MRSDLLAQIHLPRLLHNYRALRAKLKPGVAFCAPLKADAYGHGVRIVAPALHEAGADMAAVATIPEAVELRQIGWKKPILVLGNVLAVADDAERSERMDAIARHRLTVTIADEAGVRQLSTIRAADPIDVHLKLDTGMGRMGVVPDEAAALVKQIKSATTLRLTGIYSHFATADFELPDLAHAQLATFKDTLSRLSDLLPPGVVRHLANSAATITLPDAHFDMVRPGLALYGYWPARHMSAQIDLQPILRLVSHVTLIKNLPAGHCVGYGQSFTTTRPTRLGIVPIGYFDGYIRSLSNAAQVRVLGGLVPVIGRVSMDQMAIDLTDIPRAAVGAEVVLIDEDPRKPNSVMALAEQMGTIPYEVTCLLGQRIHRISVGESCAKSPSTHN
jgi:alanine racemase